MLPLAELLDDAGVGESELRGGECECCETLRPISLSAVDGEVMERDGWPLWLKRTENGTAHAIQLDAGDGWVLEIITARLASTNGVKRIELGCKLDNFSLSFTIEQVRANTVLGDELTAMVHPMMRKRSASFVSRARRILSGA